MSNRYYITTPIYYANDKPHIGHAYTTLLADVLTRFHRLMGSETFFLTGTDEHGQKVQQAARDRGVTPQQQVDEFHQRFKHMWEKLEIEYDRFIRTTDHDHIKFVQARLAELHAKGEIYEELYEGWYSVSEERFFSEDELVYGKDPISNKPVEWLSEKNYFFKMGSYQKQLIDYINENPDFIQPEHRKNEVLGFLRKPLKDLCISRPKSRLQWGVELPFDSDYVTYVWFDALLNYRSGVDGITFSDQKPVWPADCHLIGKDILTTHAVYWPTMLMAMGIELPRTILAHGWWLSGESKMSKSSGNAVDPLQFIEEHGVDQVRYCLMREMVLGLDATFTPESFISRINSDLANDLGNALNRVVRLVQTNCGEKIPAAALEEQSELDLKSAATRISSIALDLVDQNKLSFAIEEIMNLVRETNRYLEVRAPWKLAKAVKEGATSNEKEQLDTSMWYAAEALRLSLLLLSPVMPRKCKEGLAMLGIESGQVSRADLEWGLLKSGTVVGGGPALFPRIEVKKEKPAPAKQGQPKGGQTGVKPFQKLKLLVAEVKEVADHPDADSLYVLQVFDGSDMRQVCAGLKNDIAPQELQNRHVVLLANLKEAKIRGQVSQGMLLAADDKDGRAVLPVTGDIKAGTVLQFGETAPAPKSKLSIKDFEKCTLTVKDSQLINSEGLVLQSPSGEKITAPVDDGSSVH